VHIRGYRRLLDTKMNLDGKIIAVVGPNEAGKTTLLRALTRLDSHEKVSASELSRSRRPSAETQHVEAAYILDSDDQAALADLDLVEAPVRMSYSRRVQGGVLLIGLQPLPKRRRTEFNAALSSLRVFTESDAINELDPAVEEDESEVPSLGQHLRDAVALLSDETNTIDDQQVEQVEAIASDLSGDQFDAIQSALRYAVQWRRLPDVGQEARNRISERAPKFLLFSDADRDLSTEYELQPIAANPPPALANLARLAKLDLEELLAAILESDHGRVVTLQNRANKRLAEVFARSWRQSVITVELNVQGTVVKVLIKENDDLVTSLDERSAGLRMFAALAAFIATRDTTVPPALLIDEADTHLHYDAQADLVNVLLTQQEAAQVIYTTHSPGCLPPDLGTGIRAVVPSESDPAVSTVRNNFWGGHIAGFSPLLFAMGAGAAAFTPSRYAVLAEGASEMILMPSLIRAVTGLDSLPYQVAPGLSEAPTSQYPEMDLQGARVAFTVDGDPGGLKLRERLVKGGVPGERIAVLDGMTLEDTVDLDAYRAAVHAEADAANKAPTTEMPADMFGEPRARAVKAWYEQAGLIAPSKIAVANRLVQDGQAVPSEVGSVALKALHDQLTTILGT
jgi:predicted ATP-dependent endonuclease of OLD family